MDMKLSIVFTEEDIKSMITDKLIEKFGADVEVYDAVSDIINDEMSHWEEGRFQVRYTIIV